MRPALLCFLALAWLASAAPAQLCGNGETFFKNDKLPQVPGGPAQISVIPGLCEGEAMGGAWWGA